MGGDIRLDSRLATKYAVLQLDHDPRPRDVRWAFAVRLGRRKQGVSPTFESPPGTDPSGVDRRVRPERNVFKAE